MIDNDLIEKDDWRQSLEKGFFGSVPNGFVIFSPLNDLLVHDLDQFQKHLAVLTFCKIIPDQADQILDLDLHGHMINVFYRHAGLQRKVLFGLFAEHFQERKKRRLLMKFSEQLKWLDGQKKPFHHFLELVVLEIAVVVLDVVYGQLFGQLQLKKHDVGVLWGKCLLCFLILPGPEDVLPFCHHFNSFNPLHKFVVLVNVDQFCFTSFDHLEQPLDIGHWDAHWERLDFLGGKLGGDQGCARDWRHRGPRTLDQVRHFARVYVYNFIHVIVQTQAEVAHDQVEFILETFWDFLEIVSDHA